MEFFQQGIVHFKIHEEKDSRFYITETGVGVDHALVGEDLTDKVIQGDGKLTVQTLSDDHQDSYETSLSFSEFLIT